MDYLRTYTSLLKADSYLSESKIEDILKDFEGVLKNGSDNDQHFTDKYHEGMSTVIYEFLEKIRKQIDDLKNLSKSSDIRGISSSRKIMVMLLGETSAGKTSFLERIYGEDCGETGANPITAFPVIHKITSAKSYLRVKFRKTFTIEENNCQSFKKFLNQYDLSHLVEFNHNEFTFTDEDVEIGNKDAFINFIYGANEFPEAIELITWNHRESSKQIGFTKFADFLDMPGTGGMDKHEDNINRAMQSMIGEVDVVLYLLKSDQGIPSSYDYLKNLYENLRDQNLEFYFMYQIDNSDTFEKKASALKEFVGCENSEAKDPFDDEQKEFYSRVSVVDARGARKERKRASMALARVLMMFFLDKCPKFLKNLQNIEKPKQLEILKSKIAIEDNRNNVNQHLFEFLEKSCKKCTGGKLVGIETLKKDFKNEFCLDDLYNLKKTLNLSTDLETTINDIYKEIDNIIYDMFEFLSVSSFFDKVFDTKDTKDKKFDTTKYNQEFYPEYEKHSSWQSLMYKIQSLHWLLLTYNNESKLENVYAKAAVNPLCDILEKDISKLSCLSKEIDEIEKMVAGL